LCSGSKPYRRECSSEEWITSPVDTVQSGGRAGMGQPLAPRTSRLRLVRSSAVRSATFISSSSSDLAELFFSALIRSWDEGRALKIAVAGVIGGQAAARSWSVLRGKNRRDQQARCHHCPRHLTPTGMTTHRDMARRRPPTSGITSMLENPAALGEMLSPAIPGKRFPCVPPA